VPDERDRVLLGQRRVLQVDHHEVESGLRAGLHDVDRRQLDEGPDQSAASGQGGPQLAPQPMNLRGHG